MQGSCQLTFELFAGKRILPIANAKIEIEKDESNDKITLTTNTSGKSDIALTCNNTYTASIEATGFVPVIVTDIRLGHCERAVVAIMLYPLCKLNHNTIIKHQCRTCNICSLTDDEILELWQQDTTHLQLGSRSSAVRITENRLNRIHKYYPVIPLVMSVDNCYTKETMAAILAFQHTFDLAATGVLDKVTYTCIAELAENISEAEELRENACSLTNEIPNQTLVQGNQGDQVLRLQHLLQVAHIFYALPEVPIHGIFDENTYSAVTAFQKFFGLAETGTLNLQDWEALYELFLGVCTVYPFVVQAQISMALGDTGYAVSLLQVYLNAIACRYSTLSCSVTSTFDEATALAVAAFRIHFGLPQNTKVDSDFWKKLLRVRLLL